MAFLLLVPVGASAQEPDVSRRPYTFVDDRLVVQVDAESAGVLRVVRGEPGKVEVTGRAADGFVGFGLGGETTRQLRLTSVGEGRVEYLVIVPENVRLTVQLPKQGGGDLGPSQGTALYRWGGESEGAETARPSSTPHVVYSSNAAPAVVDLRDLAAVRSVSVRFEGSSFRISASRPFSAVGTPTDRIEFAITGEPADIVIQVPRAADAFSLRAGTHRLVTVAGGQPTTSCTGVAVQRPSANQVWYTFHPQSGRLECR
jgi:hypothetical protein